MIWKLAFPREYIPRGREQYDNHRLLYPILEVTYPHFYYILSGMQTNLVQCKRLNIRKQGSLGAILEAAYDNNSNRIVLTAHLALVFDTLRIK